jgi:hypothetical protein
MMEKKETTPMAGVADRNLEGISNGARQQE